MKYHLWIGYLVLVAGVACLLCAPAAAQQPANLIETAELTELETKLDKAGESTSSARKKLAIKRVIREASGLLKDNQTAPNRYELLGLLFRAQQQLVQLEGSTTNRAAFLETCKQLADAPDEYAAVRLDAELLLSQIESAKRGEDPQQRAQALLPLVDRYQDTEVETKVIKVAMVMALELGNTSVIGRLREIIAERCPGDYEMINFQRDKLAGQVFGAPFIARLEQADGNVIRFPMDTLGKTTELYFWSKEDGGLEDLKELATAWNKVKEEYSQRLRFLSINLDDLPDGGESILREHGLDWPAIKLPGGRDHPIFKTYVRWDPKVITVSPNGYAAIFMSGGRSSRGYERNLQSMQARSWTNPLYTSQLQSIYAGEFLVVDPSEPFDPAAPAELKVRSNATQTLPQTANSVPEEKLRAIDACFVKPPMRYQLPPDEAIANYRKADKLCVEAISAHPDASDLWIVRKPPCDCVDGAVEVDLAGSIL